mmetsp:Transcript_12586/g.50339  ORF Transcript_12586/g.50339 Transcript_12586/m.50339 type:complete len:539 (+) Transcript_12586:2-1618(+)
MPKRSRSSSTTAASPGVGKAHKEIRKQRAPEEPLAQLPADLTLESKRDMRLLKKLVKSKRLDTQVEKATQEKKKKKKSRRKKLLDEERGRSAPELRESGGTSKGRYRTKKGRRRMRRSKEYDEDGPVVLFDSGDDEADRFDPDDEDRDFVIDLVDEPPRRMRGASTSRSGLSSKGGSLANLLATPARLLGSDSSSSSSSFVQINSSESWVSTWSSSWESTWTSVSGSSSEDETIPSRPGTPALEAPPSKGSGHTPKRPDGTSAHHHHHHHIHRHTHHHHIHHTTNKHHQQSDLVWLTKLLIPLLCCRLNPRKELVKWHRSRTEHEKLFWFSSPQFFLYLCQITLFWQACLIALTVGAIFRFLTISWYYIPFAIAILVINLCYFMPTIVYMYSICTNIGQYTKMEFIHQVHAKPGRKTRATKQQHMKPVRRPNRRHRAPANEPPAGSGSDSGGSTRSTRSMKELRAAQDELLAKELPPHPRRGSAPQMPSIQGSAGEGSGGGGGSGGGSGGEHHHHHVNKEGGTHYGARYNRAKGGDGD